MASSATSATNQTFDPFPAAALQTNRNGYLTDEQCRGYSKQERSFRKSELGLAVIAGVIAALLATATGPAPNAQYRPLAAAVAAAIAALLVFRAFFWPDKLTNDLRSGTVITIEGALNKWHYDTDSGSSVGHFMFQVEHQRFEVSRAAYEWAPDAGYVRLYYLPRSHRVVNMERLPDPPVPQQLLSSPTAAIGAMATALKSHDSTQIAEMRAEFAAVEHQMQAERQAAATPPPASQRDPRPLAQSILGSWKSTFASLDFKPDGTVVATFVNGQQRAAHWSVGADGKLHSDALGSQMAADAWVAGDTLSISADGEGMAFKKAD